MFLSILLLSILLGLSGGIGIFTFGYAKGASYLSNDPEACHNCHVMNQVFEGWTKGGHQHVAVCNDCHVPHDFFGKWFTKADNGFHHSWAFTFKKIPVSIRARQMSKEIVQNNCIRCHSQIFEHLSPLEEDRNCVTCHREVGHTH